MTASRASPTVSRRRRLGAISLTVAATGMVATEAARHAGVGDPRLVAVLAGAFEAGTVGGVADWFAVTALFREIPFPFFGRHTNLLVRNRGTFTRGIVDMVQNRWLAPIVVRERLQALSASKLLVQYLGEDATRARTVAALRVLLSRVADDLDGEAIVGFLERLLKDQLEGVDVGRPLGAWMVSAIGRKDHHALWDLLLGAAERSLADGTLRLHIDGMLRRAVKKYGEANWKRSLGARAAEFFGVLDYGEAADKAVEELARFIRDARGTPNHPLREKLDHVILDFARDLEHGRGEAIRIVEDFKRRVVESADARDVIRSVLARFKGTLKRQLADEHSDLSRAMDALLAGIVRDLDASPETRERLDTWVRTVISDLVERHHGVIGEMVESSIAKLSDEDLVREVEEKVGDDLQMIRVNGAVIGALVGAVIAILRLVVA
jgi:uncharacterized membrane-anchored protein YjiN (DUF445 family)